VHVSKWNFLSEDWIRSTHTISVIFLLFILLFLLFM